MTEYASHRNAKLRIARLFQSEGWQTVPDSLYGEEAVETRLDLDGQPHDYRPDVLATKGKFKVIVELDGRKYHNNFRKDERRRKALLDETTSPGNKQHSVIWFRRYPVSWIVGKRAEKDEDLKVDLSIIKK